MLPASNLLVGKLLMSKLPVGKLPVGNLRSAGICRPAAGAPGRRDATRADAGPRADMRADDTDAGRYGPARHGHGHGHGHGRLSHGRRPLVARHGPARIARARYSAGDATGADTRDTPADNASPRRDAETTSPRHGGAETVGPARVIVVTGSGGPARAPSVAIRARK